MVLADWSEYPYKSSVIWVCPVCSYIFALILRNFTALCRLIQSVTYKQRRPFLFPFMALIEYVLLIK